MEVNFIKLSPTQNMTILIKDEIDESLHDEIGRAVMSYDSVYAEQIGFIERPASKMAAARLNMVGGFCGNATLCMAAVVARDKGLPAGSRIQIPLEVPSSDDILNCDVVVNETSFTCKLKMPDPLSVEDIRFTFQGHEYDAGMVHFPGISHMIIDTAALKTDKNALTDHVIAHLAEFTANDTAGVMFYHDGYMDPFVYTGPIDCRVWERGCASGTSAAGAYFAKKNGKDLVSAIRQPGGIIKAYVKCANGLIQEICVEGEVRIVAEGVAYV